MARMCLARSPTFSCHRAVEDASRVAQTPDGHRWGALPGLRLPSRSLLVSPYPSCSPAPYASGIVACLGPCAAASVTSLLSRPAPLPASPPFGGHHRVWNLGPHKTHPAPYFPCGSILSYGIATLPRPPLRPNLDFLCKSNGSSAEICAHGWIQVTCIPARNRSPDDAEEVGGIGRSIESVSW